LNQGRIPLTDAELLKAVLLAKVQEKHPGRETEIAAQWDGIERDLQRPDVWAFVTGQAAAQGRVTLQHGTRIDLLFDTLAKKPATGAPRITPLTKCALSRGRFTGLLGESGSTARANPRLVRRAALAQQDRFPGDLWIAPAGHLRPGPGARQEGLRLCPYLTHQGHTEYPRRRSDDTLRYDNSSHKVTLQRLLLLFNIEVCRDRFPSRSTLAPHGPWSISMRRTPRT
jgi:hypothetical protein